MFDEASTALAALSESRHLASLDAISQREEADRARQAAAIAELEAARVAQTRESGCSGSWATCPP